MPIFANVFLKNIPQCLVPKLPMDTVYIIQPKIDSWIKNNPCFHSKLRCISLPALKLELSTGRSPGSRNRQMLGCLFYTFLPQSYHKINVNKNNHFLYFVAAWLFFIMVNILKLSEIFRCWTIFIFSLETKSCLVIEYCIGWMFSTHSSPPGLYSIVHTLFIILVLGW